MEMTKEEIEKLSQEIDDRAISFGYTATYEPENFEDEDPEEDAKFISEGIEKLKTFALQFAKD